MATVRSFEHAHIEQLARILGETDAGLTGSEITEMLCICGIPDVLGPGSTKWRRILEALWSKQTENGCGNHVLRFVQEVMKPVRHRGDSEWHEATRAELNEVFAFAGLELGSDAQFRGRSAATTLSEAEGRAQHLRKKLRDRGVHPSVLRFCRAEFVQKSYFHAVLEATKSIAERVRKLAGLSMDSHELVEVAFGVSKGGGAPLVAFNSLQDPNEENEHRGLMNLMKAAFSAFRNVTAHAPKVNWPIEEQDALDILSLASLLHRRLDRAVNTRTGAPGSSVP
ncbi:MAG: TIGR02391 family protein [Planctomycetes bacterium]|nr:TIGR02391 family protein [Planctomycetota bacterium]